MFKKLSMIGIATTALLGASGGIAAVATAETRIPVHIGFSSGWECFTWVMDRNDGNQYDCEDHGRDGWTAVWIVN